MDVLREREVKDSLERQLMDEQKIRGKNKMRSFSYLYMLYKVYTFSIPIGL